MEAFGKINKHIRRVLLALLAAVVVASCMFIIGCASRVDVSLTVDSITLSVGEKRNILPYVKFLPATADERNIVLASSSNCVEIDGTYVVAVSTGSADVTVKSTGGAATLKVEVNARGADSLTVTADGDTVQTVKNGDTPKSVTFTALYGDSVGEVEWIVDGVKKAEGSTFEFAPKSYGEFTVIALAQGLTAVRTVKIYRETSVSVDMVGSLDQAGGSFSAVTFTARETIDSRNPSSIYEWSVNDVVYADGAVFVFTPTAAGEYKVSLKVNGRVCGISGADGVSITAKGARAPLGEVVFDDKNGVYIEWVDGEYIVRVTVITEGGSRKDIERSDAQHAYRFERGRFNAEELIDVCAQDPSEYRIILAAEGTREFTFTQYPLEAQEYISDKVLYGNRFISSAADGENYINELYACGVKSSSCYIARNAGEAVGAMQDRARALGMNAITTVDGNIVTFEFSDYDNAPARYGSGSAERMYSELPHIEYNAAARRPYNYVLAIDRVRQSVEVSDSEQLLYAVMRGIRPIPTENSVAARIYVSARDKLISVIGKEYTAEQKVHAIYDWLQWISVRDKSNDATSCGRFLEGVFGSLDIAMPDSGLRRAVVTSEGMAKAFALMCGMEGIDCVIVGYDNNEYNWNKVRIDGLWYNVDVFGGKITNEELGIIRPSEMTSHRGLLLDDDTAASRGLLCDNDAYAAFDASKYYFMQKHTYDGVYCDYYIDSAEKDDYATVKAAVFGAFSSSRLGMAIVPLVGATENFTKTTLGAEFCLYGGYTDDEAQRIAQNIAKAAREYATEALDVKLADGAIVVYSINGFIQVVIAVPSSAQTEGV